MNAGHWWFITGRNGERIGMGCYCPCGCCERAFIPIVPIDGLAYWNWDDNVEEPTLSPAIQLKTRCAWRGHMQKGVFVPERMNGHGA